jgi:hypothetical protein
MWAPSAAYIFANFKENLNDTSGIIRGLGTILTWNLKYGHEMSTIWVINKCFIIQNWSNMCVYLLHDFTSSIGAAGKVSTDAWVCCALIYILTLGIESNPRIVNISRITGTVKASHCVYTLKIYCALWEKLRKGN